MHDKGMREETINKDNFLLASKYIKLQVAEVQIFDRNFVRLHNIQEAQLVDQ